MSSSAGTSIITSHHHQSYQQSQQHHIHQNGTFTSLESKQFLQKTSSSTIYHSPQSSPPNESSPKPITTMMMTMLEHDGDDDKPLDFSSKSPSFIANSAETIDDNRKTTTQPQELSSKSVASASKKVHPKFMKRHHQTEHHCFTTPSPSPPEHRIPINQLPSPNSSKLNSNPTANVFPLVNQDIFGKLLQEMTSQIQPATNNFSQSHQVLNETILQLAKLNSSQILSSPNSSVIDSDNSANTNAKAVQLLNLLTKVNDQQCIPSKNIVEQFLNTNNNNNNNNHHQTSLSPQKEFISQHKYLLSEQSLVINGGGLLTTAPHESLTRSEQQNLIENTSSSTSKYTRPFKALYNNKDVGLLSQKHSPSSTTTTTSSPFPLETLATADSLLGSDQAYLMFRSQMLSMSKQRQSSMEERKSSTNRKSQHNTSANSSKSLDFTSDENSNGSSFNGTAIVDNQAITETTAQNSHHSIVTGLSPSATGSGRKRARPLPDNLKDEAYWERRRKNNEAAKRSRDLRRAKEDEIAIRASFLEHENRQLKLKLIEAELKLEKKDTLIATLQNQLSSLK